MANLTARTDLGIHLPVGYISAVWACLSFRVLRFDFTLGAYHTTQSNTGPRVFPALFHCNP